MHCQWELLRPKWRNKLIQYFIILFSFVTCLSLFRDTKQCVYKSSSAPVCLLNPERTRNIKAVFHTGVDKRVDPPPTFKARGLNLLAPYWLTSLLICGPSQEYNSFCIFNVVKCVFYQFVLIGIKAEIRYNGTSYLNYDQMRNKDAPSQSSHATQ